MDHINLVRKKFENIPFQYPVKISNSLVDNNKILTKVKEFPIEVIPFLNGETVYDINDEKAFEFRELLSEKTAQGIVVNVKIDVLNSNAVAKLSPLIPIQVLISKFLKEYKPTHRIEQPIHILDKLSRFYGLKKIEKIEEIISQQCLEAYQDAYGYYVTSLMGEKQLTPSAVTLYLTYLSIISNSITKRITEKMIKKIGKKILTNIEQDKVLFDALSDYIERNQIYLVLIIEKIDESLDRFIKKTKIYDFEFGQELESIIGQVIMALQINKIYQISHNDLHYGNVMLNPKIETLYYKLETNGVETFYKIKTHHNVHIIDYGRISMIYGGETYDCKIQANAVSAYTNLDKSKWNSFKTYNNDLIQFCINIDEFVTEIIPLSLQVTHIPKTLDNRQTMIFSGITPKTLLFDQMSEKTLSLNQLSTRNTLPLIESDGKTVSISDMGTLILSDTVPMEISKELVISNSIIPTKNSLDSLLKIKKWCEEVLKCSDEDNLLNRYENCTKNILNRRDQCYIDIYKVQPYTRANCKYSDPILYLDRFAQIVTDESEIQNKIVYNLTPFNETNK